MIDQRIQPAGSDRLVTGMTWLIALAVIVALSARVLAIQGNLAWDDADYLRRGLTNARIAESSGALWVLPVALDRLLVEAPKPPWLIAWIELGALVVGRHHFDLLILLSSVLPYAFLLLAVIIAGRWLSGPRGGLLASICLVCSRSSLAMGGKVMVESFLALWILLAYALAASVLARPSRGRSMALGAVIGLGLLTKLTVVLFLPAILVYALVTGRRRECAERSLANQLFWCGIVAVAVAGPWYGRNLVEAARFAAFSARYNELAELRPERVPALNRVVVMAEDLAGWPLCATVFTAVVAACATRFRRAPETPIRSGDEFAARTHFTRMAWLGALTAAVTLLVPPYFDSRFLIPIWPVLAVDVGTRLAGLSTRLRLLPKVVVGIGLAASVVAAATSLTRAPLAPTYWNTAGLIDELVSKHRVAILVNLGNCAAWNVCKTGLINELRDQPGNCFVLHDLTKVTDDRSGRLLSHADAVVVLDRSEIPPSLLQSSPGLNRGYEARVESLKNDPRFERVALRTTAGLPQLSVYVRREPIEQAGETSKNARSKSRY